MPTPKGKGGSMSHRYRPASEYDDATLVQKREYWRNKKREQRARLSGGRGKSARDGRGENIPLLNAPAGAPSSSLSSNDESHNSASRTGRAVKDSLLGAAGVQKDKWLQSVRLNKVVIPEWPVSCSMSAKAAGGDATPVKYPAVRIAVRRAVTSSTSSGTHLNTSSSVPPVRLTRITNGSSPQTATQPSVSMRGAPIPVTQHKALVAPPVRAKLSPANATAGRMLVSSPGGSVLIKTEGETTNATPQSGTASAFVTAPRAKGVGNARPSPASEEDKAARRREHWRIKKREQRAKLAARTVEVRERTKGAETTCPRVTAQNPGPAGGPVLLPAQTSLRGAGQKRCPPPVNTNDGARASLQTDQIKVHTAHGNKFTQTANTSGGTYVRKTADSYRKLPSYVHLSHVTRGISRCKTPRQRFIEAQKNFMIHRRCKSPLMMFGARSMPKIDPNDTPEQIIAKRREYWRIKKREQRAKMSMEVKARLKEKDSLMRRVKRYQKILEDMRKARALAHSSGSLVHASDAIGGFIKEDGTLTNNMPQIPPDYRTEEDKRDDELRGARKNTSIAQRQRPPDAKRRAFTPVRIQLPPPPLRPAHVKVSFPLAGQAVDKPPRPLSIRPQRTQLESPIAPNSQPSAVHAVGQLTLTHPQSPRSAASSGSTPGSDRGGCVMKMSVSSSAPSLLALSLDPGLTEEERMAKKREYWRIKKREQRAARAVRLKHGLLQARANAALQRRKAQKQMAANPAPPSRSPTARAGHDQPLPRNNTPVISNVNVIKQESDTVAAADLNFPPEQAICPDIKPPASPPPPPPPQPESDPALSADSQATTLLAVASMKKLLEESLSTVTDSKSVQTDVKTETTEEDEEPDTKPNLPQLFFEKDDIAPIAADLTLQIQSWQPNSDAAQEDPPSPQFKISSPISEALPPLPASGDVQRPARPDLTEACDGPSSPRGTRSAKTAGRRNRCSPEPTDLHPVAPTSPDGPQPQERRREQQARERGRSDASPSAQSGLTSLQRKREYWKLMKRQQRARVKARQRDRQGGGDGGGSRLSPRSIQGPGSGTIDAAQDASPPAAALHPKPSATSLSPVSSIPPVLLVSQTTSDAEQSPDALRVQLPVTGGEQSVANTGPSTSMSDSSGAPESPQLSPEWMSQSTDEDSAPSLPTLKPPENPLSSINLQPIEPPGHSPRSVLSPIKIPCAQSQGATLMIPSPTKLAPVSTMVPPKPIPGEPEEDFLRRKREYWRIKKKEQRARKAIRDKGGTPKKTADTWRPIPPVQDIQTPDSDQWMNSSEESEHLISDPVDPVPESFPYISYAAHAEDESQLLFDDYESNAGEEGPVSDAVWRNRYLMDYDPLNQLLVCMVCGDLQYSHVLEGVRAHIEEAHPHTLTLEPEEKQRILVAWDEQVSQRERFFTSQLQQHSGALTEAQRN
ncbi:uncharacterized protein [Brachyistius frenatus]|uniref:uncharacterized protein n=1 Tax=Brachyistius frenatus TaxID=100188 RepID=UPI0037E98C67